MASPIPLPSPDPAPVTTAQVVDLITAALSLHATGGAALAPVRIEAMEGTDDFGTKSRNAIALDFGPGSRFIVFIAAAPDE